MTEISEIKYKITPKEIVILLNGSLWAFIIPKSGKGLVKFMKADKISALKLIDDKIQVEFIDDLLPNELLAEASAYLANDTLIANAPGEPYIWIQPAYTEHSSQSYKSFDTVTVKRLRIYVDGKVIS